MAEPGTVPPKGDETIGWVRQPVDPVRVVWRTAGGVAAGRTPGSWTLSHDGSVPAIVLDFGRELHGGVVVRVGEASGDGHRRLLVRFGESVSEAMSDAPCRDVCPVEPGRTYELGSTGFRFVRLDLIDVGAFVELSGVVAVLVTRSLERKGSFRCSDDRLDRLWRAGADTVHLCLQEHLWDGVKRDRQVWAGDLHPAARVVAAVFGGLGVVTESLDFVRDEWPLPGWMNGIPAYSLWWVLTQRDWYARQGDRDYLGRQRVYLLELLGLLAERVGGDGTESLDGWRFLDWASCGDDRAVDAGYHALLHWGLGAGAELCEILGEPVAESGCRAAMDRLRRHAPAGTSSKAAHALRVLAGLADPLETNLSVLARDPLRGLSPFLGASVLRARALAGDVGGCLDLLRRYWGTMLGLGATTFWEDFDPSWAEDALGIDRVVSGGRRDAHADGGRHFHRGLVQSLCHAWSAGPTDWLSECVLGVEPVEPGCGVVRVVPRLGDLDWAEGSYPTPRGGIHVRHEKAWSGSVRSRVDAPDGVRVLT